MMNRRSFLAIFSAGFVATIVRPAKAEVPSAGRWNSSYDSRPRASHYQAPADRAAALHRRMALPPDLEVSYPRGQTFGSRWISTGEIFVEVDSPEGEAIAREMAVNLRRDGTLRHRQHHWPRN